MKSNKELYRTSIDSASTSCCIGYRYVHIIELIKVRVFVCIYAIGKFFFKAMCPWIFPCSLRKDPAVWERTLNPFHVPHGLPKVAQCSLYCQSLPLNIMQLVLHSHLCPILRPLQHDHLVTYLNDVASLCWFFVVDVDLSGL